MTTFLARRALRAAIAATLVGALLVPALPASADTLVQSPTATAISPDSSPRAQSESATTAALSAEPSRARVGVQSLSASAASASATSASAASASGTVTDPAGVGVADVEVSAFTVTGSDDARDYDLAATVLTDANGVYTFESLAAGAYDLFFDPGDSSPLAWGWLESGINPSSDAPVTIGDETVELGAHALQSAARVQGSVTSSRGGAGIGNVETTLWGSDGVDPDTGIALFSPIDFDVTIAGHFSFANLPAGYYLVEYAPVSASYRGEWWNNATRFETASVLTIAAGDVANADAVLSVRVDLGTVAVSGNLTNGATVAAAHKKEPATTYTYQWYADGKAITGAKKSTLTLTTAHQHKRISVKVSGSSSGAVSSSATSAATARILLTTSIAISGRRAIMQDHHSEYTRYTLSATRGTWTSGVTISYQWYSDGKKISGATGRVYRLRLDDVGTRITVKATGRKSGYATVTRTATTSTKIAQIGQPAITSRPRVNHSISVAWGDWTAGTTQTFRLLAEGRLIWSHTKTKSASMLPIRLIPSWALGKRLTFEITGSKPGYGTYKLSAVSATVTW